jgi:hypothetical protein
MNISQYNQKEMSYADKYLKIIITNLNVSVPIMKYLF